MLYTESKQYLIDKLKAAGIKSKPFTTEKALEKSQESHIGAVLFERETFTRNGSKKRYRDEEGTLAQKAEDHGTDDHVRRDHRRLHRR